MSNQILASLDDINANLPGRETGGSTSGYPVVVEATDDNTLLLQVSIARVVRGYLSGAIAGTTLTGWNSPSNTPDIVREAAAKMIAAQLYFNQVSRTNLTIEDRNFAQILYNQAMDILNKIISGEINIGQSATVETSEHLSSLDFFPVDDTDRAFTMSMDL